MRDAIKVSVIVPVYNVERYLRQCLESIRQQTLKEIEVICVNDGSTDGSSVILEDYARMDKRFHIIHKKNTGYGNTMNIGIQHAKGAYIGILESDDYAETTMFETLFRVAEQDELDVVKANYYNFSYGIDTEHERLSGYPYGLIISCETHPDIIHLTDSIWSSLYRRDFIFENNITFSETPGASYQDTSFACMVWIHAKRIEFIRDTVLHYRMDNADSSIHAPGKVFCICDEWGRVERYLQDYPEKLKLLKKHQVAVKYAGYIYNYRRLSACYQYALLVQIEKELKEDAAQGHLDQDCFDTGLWNQLQQILKDHNLFFTETSKDIQDERMLMCDVRNYPVYCNALLEEIKKYRMVILYGAGKIGKMILEWLKGEKIGVSYFAVTTTQSISYIDDVPVLCLEELVDYRDKAVVIITVKESNQYEIYRNLDRAGFQNILVVDKFLRMCAEEKAIRL